MANIKIPQHIVDLQQRQARIMHELKDAKDKVRELEKELNEVLNQISKEINILQKPK